MRKTGSTCRGPHAKSPSRKGAADSADQGAPPPSLTEQPVAAAKADAGEKADAQAAEGADKEGAGRCAVGQ